MRTTVTLDEDVAAALKRTARERGISFKEALNAAVRRGLGESDRPARPYRLPAYDMHLKPGIDLTKALQLAAALEDDEIVRKLEMRK